MSQPDSEETSRPSKELGTESADWYVSNVEEAQCYRLSCYSDGALTPDHKETVLLPFQTPLKLLLRYQECFTLTLVDQNF